MLKIGKGLKKKKKSKHKGEHQHEDDEFTAEELEKYRREHQQAAPSSSVNENNEWQKFQQLTSGVDSVLKKTQGDLDRIKSTSFFQKKAPPPKPEPPKPQHEHGESRRVKQVAEAKVLDAESEHDDDDDAAAAAAAANDDDDDEQQDEDIFDTSYVDVVASGEIQLAYIPDSPSEDAAVDDFDPFDTTVADKVIIGRSSKKGRKLVPIGAAVEVLTGRVQKVPTTPLVKSSRRVKPQHLLLNEGEPDLDVTTAAATAAAAAVTTTAQSPVKSILDDDHDVIAIDEPIDLTKPIIIAAPSCPVQVPHQENINFVPDLAEFDSLTHPQSDDDDELDDEFASLAAASATATVISEIVIPHIESVDTDWSAFDEAPSDHQQLAAPAPSRNLLEGSNSDLSKLETVIEPQAIANDDFSTYHDPFDTSLVDQIQVPGKTELKFLEAELLHDNNTKQENDNDGDDDDDDDDDFDPRKHEECKVLSPIPSQPSEQIVADDPFDTSFVATVAPGKIELKLLESELENLPAIAQDHTLEGILKRENLSKPVVSSVEQDCLLLLDENVNSKVLTPFVEQLSTYSDPFDTSASDNIGPGKAELKLLENELLNCETPKPALSLDAVLPNIANDIEKLTDKHTFVRDVLTSDEPIDIGLKPLTPSVDLDEDFDPFDTSLAGTLLPGKTELKLLESELIN